MVKHSFLGLLALGLSATLVQAQAPEMKTVMTERGKVLVSEDFQSTFAKDWKAGKGKWEVTNGALQGSEVAADMHAATFRRPTPVKNVIIQYSFKIDGAKSTSLSLNASKGHLSRVAITPTSITVKKDSTDKNKTDKAQVLDTAKVDLKADWHTLVLEQAGKEMLASLDGKVIGYGRHEGLDQPIANIGFTVSGQSVSFKNLRIWEASPNASWPTEREKIIQSRSKN